MTAEEAAKWRSFLASSEDARRELAELQATVDLVRGCLNGAATLLRAGRSAEERWTLWWPSVRMTGLAASVATMLLVGLVAGDMLDVLEQARFGGDDSEYASDDSAFASAAAAAAPAPAPESAAAVAMDAPASPEPEVAAMKSVAGQDESVPVPAAPAAAAPRMAKVESSDEPAAAMQQDTTEEAPQASEVESREEPLVAMQQDMTEEAPQADAAQSSEEPPVAKQQP